MGILSVLSGPILGAIFTALAGLITAWMRSKQDQQLGAQVVSTAAAQKTAATETAIAQAETTAPRGQAQDVSALQSGSF